jgi:hypothetical protein
MQCTDIFFLKADICQLGVDQRKTATSPPEPDAGQLSPQSSHGHLRINRDGTNSR